MTTKPAPTAEFRRAEKLMQRCRRDLAKDGVKFDNKGPLRSFTPLNQAAWMWVAKQMEKGK